MNIRLLAILVLISPASSTASLAAVQDTNLAPEDAFDAERAEIGRTLLPELIELADWCHANKLYRERDRTWSAVLFLDPDNRKARKGLRYRRSGDGWFQSKGYKEPRNRNTEKFPELYERRRLVVAPYRSLLLDRVREKSTGHTEREGLLRDLLELDREDAAVRDLLGEVRFKDTWLLRETESTLEMRKLLPHFAKASIDAAPKPESSEPDAKESTVQVVWSAGRKTRRVRVLGTSGDDEVRKTARFSHAVGDYFKSIFYRSQKHRDDLTIYVLNNPGERAALLDSMPEISEDTRELLLQAAGGWLTPHQLAQWSANPARRLDGATRQTLGTLLMDSFGIDGRHGWAWEGLGLYLTYHLTGTRLTHFFKGGTYKPVSQTTLWTQLQLPETDWMDAGRALLAGENAPKLQFLIGKNVNVMRDEDLLFSYVLAAYLLEGRPKELPELLAAVGAGTHPVDAFEEVLGASLPQLDLRIRRWLDETR